MAPSAKLVVRAGFAGSVSAKTGGSAASDEGESGKRRPRSNTSGDSLVAKRRAGSPRPSRCAGTAAPKTENESTKRRYGIVCALAPTAAARTSVPNSKQRAATPVTERLIATDES